MMGINSSQNPILGCMLFYVVDLKIGNAEAIRDLANQKYAVLS
jgi:hypothetical protein